jgi:hypothetical protein
MSKMGLKVKFLMHRKKRGVWQSSLLFIAEFHDRLVYVIVDSASLLAQGLQTLRVRNLIKISKRCYYYRKIILILDENPEGVPQDIMV